MASFIVRRFLISILVLLAATFIVYVLVANAGDPPVLAVRVDRPGQGGQDRRDDPQPEPGRPRHPAVFRLLGGALGCFVGNCDLGNTATGAPVIGGLTVAIGSTLRLVVFALVIAVVLGVAVGMVTALRQYSGLDYSVTFLAFLFFSLPVFWIAVLMKQFLAIKFNSWLQDPSIPPWVIVVSTVVAGLLAAGIVGGDRRQRLLSAAIGAAVVAVIMIGPSVTDWFAAPGIGPVLMIIMSALTALASTALISGLRSRLVLLSTGITALVGVISYFALDSLLADPEPDVAARPARAGPGDRSGDRRRSGRAVALAGDPRLDADCLRVLPAGVHQPPAGRRAGLLGEGERRGHRDHRRDHPELPG